MNYTIDIIDTVDDSHVLILENAEKSSIVLRWNGGDKKATQNIVGATLSFTLEVHTSNGSDAAFVDLFTGNETRYKVRFYSTEDDVTIWTGFLLPDSYQEPYTNGTFYIRFDAADGLGRLKGKYLAETYYTTENSVVQYIAQILKLTGLELPISIAPAIENVLEKDYNNIFLQGDLFVEKDRYKDAYKVLAKILKSMLCVVYQVEDKWIVEGFNQRHLKQVNYTIYDFEGTYVDKQKDLRTSKQLRALGTPFITMIPPLAEIVVTHKRLPQAFPETIAEEENEGWAIGQGVDGDVFPTYWYANGGYLPKAASPDYKVALYTLSGTALDASKYISLRDKVYVKKHDKLSFSATLKSEVSAKNDSDTTVNGLRIHFLLNGTTLYSVDKSFKENDLEIVFDLYASEAGLLDLRIYQPFFDGTIEDGTYSPNIFLEELTLSVVDFKDEEVFVNTINEEFTAGREEAIDFADDASGFSSAFRLLKLEEKSTEFNAVVVPVLYGFSQNGDYYAVVSLYGANLIADNIDTVYYNSVLLTDLEVTYNYQNGEQMVIKTVTSITTGDFTVNRHRTKDVADDRSHWEQWTDAVYPIEVDRYAESVAKVYRRLFPVTHEQVEFTADAAFKFNDHIQFDYVLPRNYFLTNVAWNIDLGETTGTMVRAIYQNDIVEVGADNVPPIVNAGADVILPADFGEFVEPFGVIELWHNTASAYDPDGFIQTYLWTVESGDQNARIGGVNTLIPTLKGFDGDVLELRLTVTDSDGATASDTVSFIKRFTYNLELTDELDTRTDNISIAEGYNRARIDFNPVLQPNVTIQVKGKYALDVLEIPSGGSYQVIMTFSIYKNGQRIFYSLLEAQQSADKEEGDFEFNFIDGDVVTFETYVKSELVGLVNSLRDFKADFEINSTIFQAGGGLVTGYPVGRTVHFDYPTWVA